MQQSAGREDVVFFLDPPYTKTGHRLYRYSEISHEGLFSLAASLAGDFLMTYDDATEIRTLAQKYGLQAKTVAMKSTHHTQKKELLIGRDLSWLWAKG